MSDPAPLTIARDLVSRARAAGADQADAIAVAGTEQSVTVRLGEVEKVIEAGSRGLGLRVIVGGRQAVVSTSDVSETALSRAVEDALALAQISEPDEHAGLPDPSEQATGGDLGLQLYDERIEGFTTQEAIEQARRCERAALDADPRIVNTDGAMFSTNVARVALANSHDFGAEYLTTSASLAVEAMADAGDGDLRNDYWYTAERHLHRLDEAEAVGREAAARALRQLGATKIATKQVPVVWEPRMTVALLHALAQAASGEAYYRRSTFLRDREGQPLASDRVTVVDDATLPAALASRPFDGEGLASRRNVLLERGVFQGFLFDTYNARRSGRQSTGSASRGVGSLPHVGTSNLLMEGGATAPEAMIADVPDGLYLTTLMGFGYNPTTGDFSRGAAGLWIRDGQLAEPVTEINVSGNLATMFASIDAVGDDVQWFGAAAAPSVRMQEMTVSGT